jgi:hypothetical protein
VIVVPLNQTLFHCVFLSFFFISLEKSTRLGNSLLSALRRQAKEKGEAKKPTIVINMCVCVVKEQINIYD